MMTVTQSFGIHSWQAVSIRQIRGKQFKPDLNLARKEKHG